jgi:flavorubredoxin
MRLAGIELVENDLGFSYKPTEEEWRKCYEFGAMMGQRIRS